MTLPVANFLVENVFCILDNPTDDSQRIGAREFGVWIRDLPTLIGASQPLTNAHTHSHSRVPSTVVASAPTSCRPSSRPTSTAGGSPRRPPVVLRAVISQNPADPVLDHDGPHGTLSPVLDLVLNEEDDDEEQQQQRDVVAEVENIVRNFEDQKERDKMRDILSRIEGMDKVKELSVPKPSRVLVEERIPTPRELSASSKPSSPPPVGTTKAKRGKTSFKHLGEVLQNGGGGIGGKKDIWLVVFNDVVLRCQRTGTISLPLGSAYASQVNSLREPQGKSEDANATTRRNSTAPPRNLYKFIKVGFRPFFRSGNNLTMPLLDRKLDSRQQCPVS